MLPPLDRLGVISRVMDKSARSVLLPIPPLGRSIHRNRTFQVSPQLRFISYLIGDIGYLPMESTPSSISWFLNGAWQLKLYLLTVFCVVILFSSDNLVPGDSNDTLQSARSIQFSDQKSTSAHSMKPPCTWISCSSSIQPCKRLSGHGSREFHRSREM